MSAESRSAAAAYRSLAPTRGPNLGWHLYGTGLDSMGLEGDPEEIDVAQPGPDELLVRVDAVGLCYSDVKLLQQGGDHPKLYGRDLTVEPARLGHEATVTVLEVGAALEGQYGVGQRLAVQPDIYVDGRANAYGYTIGGGLIRRHVVGPEILDADDGAYVINVDDDRMGYAAAALSEPWACVEAAYTQRRRLQPANGGTMWISGRSDDPTHYRFSNGLDAPSRIVLSDVSTQVVEMVETHRHPDTVVERRPPGESESFDDIVLLDPRSEALVTAAAARIAFRGTLNLVGGHRLDGAPKIDFGRIHYDYTAYLGSGGPDIAASYGAERNRCELSMGGVCVVVGAGPMGQMHVQRALEMADGPATVISSDLDPDRLAALDRAQQPLARASGRRLLTVNSSLDVDGVERAVEVASGGTGADDVIVTVPSVPVMADAARLLGDGGMLVLFAGVPNGSAGPLDLSDVYLRGFQFTGTSGSTVADQRRVIDRARAGELSPQRSVAAVGGIEAARDGVEAMIDGRFAGKIVLFPQLAGLPLMGLAELGERYPAVASLLDSDGAWTAAAEAQLLELFWNSDA